MMSYATQNGTVSSVSTSDHQHESDGHHFLTTLSDAFSRLKRGASSQRETNFAANPCRKNSSLIANGLSHKAPSNSSDSDSTETSHLIETPVPGEEPGDNHISRNIISPHQPTDKYHLVYLIVLLHGIGVLLPWNTFLTIATDYYIGYKFNETETKNLPFADNFVFFNILTACSQLTNLILSVFNLFAIIKIKGGLSRRINLSLIVILFICLVTIFFIFVNTQSWPYGFFLITIITVIILNSANGIYQNSVWGLIADFPAHFTNAVVQGNNLCGILVTCIYILILLMQSDIQITTSIFLGIAFIIVAFCLLTFHAVQKLPFYRYYAAKAIRARDKRLVDGQIALENPTLAMYVDVFKEARKELLNVTMVFFVTLSLFPTILLQINRHPLFIYGDWKRSQSIYLQLSVYLNFNVFATIGTFVANYIQLPSPKHLSYAIFLRIFFIPLFWLCDYGDDRQFVLIENEYFVILLVTLLAITHGFYSSLAMMYAPKQVDKSKARTVGMLSGFFLVLGIAFGIAFTFLEPIIVKNFFV